MPTTIFILMAAWGAAHGSPAMSRWLDNHRLTGPLIHHWRKGRFVPRKAKYAASISMLASALILFFIDTNIWGVALADSCMALVLIWLWMQPEPK